jgi:hypothetical protein
MSYHIAHWEDLDDMSQDDTVTCFGNPFIKVEVELKEKKPWCDEDWGGDNIKPSDDLLQKNAQIVKTSVASAVIQKDNKVIVNNTSQIPITSDSDKRDNLIIKYAAILKSHGEAIKSMHSTLNNLKKKSNNNDRQQICHYNLLSYGNVSRLAKNSVDFFAVPSQPTIKNFRNKVDTSKIALKNHQRDIAKSLDECEKNFNKRINLLNNDRLAERKKCQDNPEFASLSIEQIEEKLTLIDDKTYFMMDKIDAERDVAIKSLKKKNEFIENSLKEHLDECEKNLDDAEQRLRSSTNKTKIVDPNLDICTKVLKIVEKNNEYTENFFKTLAHYMTYGKFPVYVADPVQAPLTYVKPPIVSIQAPIVSIQAPIVSIQAPIVSVVRDPIPVKENSAPVQEVKSTRRKGLKAW